MPSNLYTVNSTDASNINCTVFSTVSTDDLGQLQINNWFPDENYSQYYHSTPYSFSVTYGDDLKESLSERLSKSKNLTDELIEEFKDDLNWTEICKNKELTTNEFIDKYEDYVDWELISSKGNLTEEFIDKYKDKIHWYQLIVGQDLTEEFMLKHYGKINWPNICLYQKLSLNFMIKYICIIDIFSLRNNKKIDPKDFEKIVKIKNLKIDKNFEMNEICQTEDILEKWLR